MEAGGVVEAANHLHDILMDDTGAQIKWPRLGETGARWSPPGGASPD